MQEGSFPPHQGVWLHAHTIHDINKMLAFDETESLKRMIKDINVADTDSCARLHRREMAGPHVNWRDGFLWAPAALASEVVRTAVRAAARSGICRCYVENDSTCTYGTNTKV